MLTVHAGWVAFGLIAVVLALALIITTVSAGPAIWTTGGGRRQASRPGRDQFRPDTGEHKIRLQQPFVVVNPTKFDDLDALRKRLTAVATKAGWAEPVFLETTAEDPGAGQAKQAVRDGADLVCALGGDGTVRSVAAALAGGDTPMGLVPAGTGNLLARNLSLPVDNLDNAMRLALRGRNKRVDIGRLVIEGEDSTEEMVFLVMAGMGFDAQIMADVPEKLKKNIGGAAYTVSGLRNLRGPQFKVNLSLDDGQPMHRRVRTVVIGNCGKLQGNLVLMPEAELDDGKLDAVLLSPKGIVSWAAVAVAIISRQRRGHDRVEHQQAESISIGADRPEPIQVDGDMIGKATKLTATVDAKALIVRVASSA